MAEPNEVGGDARERRVPRFRPLSLALGLLTGAIAVALVVSATRPDDSYPAGDVSRWEHARDSGLSSMYVAGVVVTAGSTLGLVAGGFGWRRWGYAADAIAAMTALVSAFVAWVAITAGH